MDGALVLLAVPNSFASSSRLSHNFYCLPSHVYPSLIEKGQQWSIDIARKNVYGSKKTERINSTSFTLELHTKILRIHPPLGSSFYENRTKTIENAIGKVRQGKLKSATYTSNELVGPILDGGLSNLNAFYLYIYMKKDIHLSRAIIRQQLTTIYLLKAMNLLHKNS